MIVNRFSSRLIKLNVKSIYKNSLYYYCNGKFDMGDLNFGRINIYKKAFYAIAFTGVVAAALYSRKHAEKKSELIKEAVRINAKFGRMTLFRFRNFTLPGEVLPLILELPSLNLNSDDVILCSFPKTGVTWLQEIVWLVMNDYNFDKALLTHLEERFPFLEWPVPGIPTINQMPSPKLIKTHIPLSILFNQETKIKPKVISIIRNPKDTVVSYYFFARMNRLINYDETINAFTERFLLGEVPFGPLHGHYIDSLKYSTIEENKVLLVSYEDLQGDFEGTIKKICNFLEKPFPDEKTMGRLKQHCHFNFMAVNPKVNYSHWDSIGLRNVDESQFFRKGQVSDWKNHLPEKCAELLDKYNELHFSDLFQFKDKNNN